MPSPPTSQPATVRIAGIEVLIGTADLTHGLSTSGPNLGFLADIVAFMSRITFLRCLLGDRNVEPHELRDAGSWRSSGGP